MKETIKAEDTIKVVVLDCFDRQKIKEAFENHYFIEVKNLSDEDLKETLNYGLSLFEKVDTKEKKALQFFKENERSVTNKTLINLGFNELYMKNLDKEPVFRNMEYRRKKY